MAHAVAAAPLTRLREWNSPLVDGSTLPSQGSANPALTIMALATTQAAVRLTANARLGLTEARTGSATASGQRSDLEQ
ncbi:MAG: hypothetical protein ACR2P2_10045 [Nakamurella sp.]